MTYAKLTVRARSGAGPANQVRQELCLLVPGRTGCSAHPLRDGEIVLLGSGAGCDIRVHNPYVSRRHARLTAGFGRVWLEDLASTNGSVLAGVRLGRGPACGSVPTRFLLGPVGLALVQAIREEDRCTPLLGRLQSTGPAGDELFLRTLLAASGRRHLAVEGGDPESTRALADVLHPLGPFRRTQQVELPVLLERMTRLGAAGALTTLLARDVMVRNVGNLSKPELQAVAMLADWCAVREARPLSMIPVLPRLLMTGMPGDTQGAAALPAIDCQRLEITAGAVQPSRHEPSDG